jgi:hypothetical protein
VFDSPIGEYLNGERLDRETTRVMGLAFEIARASHGVGNLNVDGMIAKAIIEHARAGERDVERLCEYALAEVRETAGRTSQLFLQAPAAPVRGFFSVMLRSNARKYARHSGGGAENTVLVARDIMRLSPRLF